MKARVLVTHKCHRNCDGCCNKDANLLSKIKLPVFTDLLKYSEIMITGGEPMLIGDSVSRFINELHSVNYRGKIYLYTTLVTPILFSILPRIDGIHFTLHYESDDSDVKGLKTLSHYAGFRASVISKRLAIDSRLYEKYDFSNIDLSGWDVIRKLKWVKDCPLPEGEELMYFNIETGLERV